MLRRTKGLDFGLILLIQVSFRNAKERDAADATYQMLLAIRYLHSLGAQLYICI